MKKDISLVLVPAVFSILLVVGLALATLVSPDVDVNTRTLLLALFLVLASFLGTMIGNITCDRIKSRRNKKFLDQMPEDFDKALGSVRKDPPC